MFEYKQNCTQIFIIITLFSSSLNIMRDIADNLTQTRGSIDEKITFFSRLKAFMCPCLTSNIDNYKNQSIQINSVSIVSKIPEERSSVGYYNKSKKTDFKLQQASKNKRYRKTSDHLGSITLRKELLQNSYRNTRLNGQRETTNLQPLRNKMASSKSFANYVIFNYPENQLVSIGINESHLLVKISSVHLNPNIQILKKEFQLPIKKKENESSFYAGEEFQIFWKERYIYFQKFDEGIKVDEHSWSKILPEKISQYISSKSSGAKVVLDGFAGIGSATLKLAAVYSCVKIIANDYNGSRLSLLLNNAKVYEVDSSIEISEQNFLQLKAKNIDVVYVQPPLSKMQTMGCKSLSIVDFEPSLDKVITKCLNLAPNIIMLLPADINIDILCSCVNKCASELKVIKNSCSIKIEKIFFQDQLRFILMTIGSLVNKDIQLVEELQYIYSKLKSVEQTNFKYKKIIKKIREEHGMIQVLNLLKLSQKLAKNSHKFHGPLKQEPLIDKFFELILEKKFMPKEKLDKLIEEQRELKKSDSLLTNQMKENQQQLTMEAVMEEEKVEESDLHFRRTEQTESEYSHYSYLSGADKSANSSLQSRLMRPDSFNNVIIKRINNSRQKRQFSPLNSPKTPTRKGPKNRATLNLQKNISENKRKRTDDL